MMKEADHFPIDDAIDELVEITGNNDDKLRCKKLLGPINEWLVDHGFKEANSIKLGNAVKKLGVDKMKSDVMHYVGVRLRREGEA